MGLGLASKLAAKPFTLSMVSVTSFRLGLQIKQGLPPLPDHFPCRERESITDLWISKGYH
jgi:hypothetical protein